MAEFYTDHNVAIGVAARLRALGHSAYTARDRGLEAAGDDEHLLVAAEQGWILISHNRQHFRLLHAAWQRWTTAWYVSSRHAGILLLDQGVPPAQLAWEIHHFIPPSQPLINTLYDWRRGTWTRY